MNYVHMIVHASTRVIVRYVSSLEHRIGEHNKNLIDS